MISRQEVLKFHISGSTKHKIIFFFYLNAWQEPFERQEFLSNARQNPFERQEFCSNARQEPFERHPNPFERLTNAYRTGIRSKTAIR